MSERRITVERRGPLWRANVEYRTEWGHWIALGRGSGMLWEDPVGDWLARFYGFTRNHAVTRARRAVVRNARTRRDRREVVELLTTEATND